MDRAQSGGGSRNLDLGRDMPRYFQIMCTFSVRDVTHQPVLAMQMEDRAPMNDSVGQARVSGVTALSPKSQIASSVRAVELQVLWSWNNAAPSASGSLICSARLRRGLNTRPPSSSPKPSGAPLAESTRTTSNILRSMRSNDSGTTT